MGCCNMTGCCNTTAHSEFLAPLFIEMLCHCCSNGLAGPSTPQRCVELIDIRRKKQIRGCSILILWKCQFPVMWIISLQLLIILQFLFPLHCRWLQSGASLVHHWWWCTGTLWWWWCTITGAPSSQFNSPCPTSRSLPALLPPHWPLSSICRIL